MTPGRELLLDEAEHLGHDAPGPAHRRSISGGRPAGDHGLRPPVRDRLDRVEQVVVTGVDRAAPVDGPEDARRAVVLDDVGEGAELLVAGAPARSPAGRRRAGSGPSRRCRRRPGRAAGRPSRGRGDRPRCRSSGPPRRRSSSSAGTSTRSAASTAAPRSASARSRASAWDAVAREAVEDDAAVGVRRVQPLEEHADRDLVGDELAALHVAPGPRARAACRPARRPGTGRPWRPCGRPEVARRGHGPGFPCPAPGAPSRTRILIEAPGRDGPASSPDEALVVAHHQLGLELLHRLDDDRDHDQDARAAEGEVRARLGMNAWKTNGATATMPRKSAPATVIRLTTRAR